MEYYIFFDDVDNAKKLYNLLKKANIKCTIAPTPYNISKICGISILYYNKDDKFLIKQIIDEHSIKIREFYEKKKDQNPNRMKFC